MDTKFARKICVEHFKDAGQESREAKEWKKIQSLGSKNPPTNQPANQKGGE